MLEAGFAFLFGLLIGSFLNVCIHRMPRELSVVRPRSFCPGCKAPIAWYDNVPVLSFLLLRGHCRRCGAAIPWRYALVEVLTGTLFAAYVWRMGLGLAALKSCLFAALLLGMIFTDLLERFLPESFTLGGLAAGLICACIVPLTPGPGSAILWLVGLEVGPRWGSLADSVLGALLPSFFLWAGGTLYLNIRKQEGLGLGDVLMMAMIGAFQGLPETLIILILGSVLGALVGLGFILIARKDWRTYYLPFGTFLGLAGIAVSLFGNRVVDWYLGQ